MTTQFLQKPVYASLLDECSSGLEQILIRSADIVAAWRNRKLLKLQLKRFGNYSSLHLRDIGLDDPQAQLQLFSGYVDTTDGNLEGLNNQLQVRR